MNERNELKDKYHDLYLQIQDVSGNQSGVNANLTIIAKDVKLMSSQVSMFCRTNYVT